METFNVVISVVKAKRNQCPSRSADISQDSLPTSCHSTLHAQVSVCLSPVKADSHPFSPLRLIQVFIPEGGSCLGCCRCTWLRAEGRGKDVGQKGALSALLPEGVAKSSGKQILSGSDYRKHRDVV